MLFIDKIQKVREDYGTLYRSGALFCQKIKAKSQIKKRLKSFMIIFRWRYSTVLVQEQTRECLDNFSANDKERKRLID